MNFTKVMASILIPSSSSEPLRKTTVRICDKKKRRMNKFKQSKTAIKLSTHSICFEIAENTIIHLHLARRPDVAKQTNKKKTFLIIQNACGVRASLPMRSVETILKRRTRPKMKNDTTDDKIDKSTVNLVHSGSC